MSSKLIPRPYPCLCASCPECGAVFSAAALNVRFSNAETWGDYAHYAAEGYTISCKDASEFKLEWCKHLQGGNNEST